MTVVGNEEGRLSESSEDFNFRESQVEPSLSASRSTCGPLTSTIYKRRLSGHTPDQSLNPSLSAYGTPRGPCATVRLCLLGLSREIGRQRVLTQMCAMSSAVSLSARQGIVAFPSSRSSLQQNTAARPSPGSH